MIGNNIKKNLKNQAGVTLMELVVAMGIFTVIMLTATAIFAMVIDGQQNSLASQNIQESMRYALEVMSKEIRTAQKNNGSCKGNNNYTPDPAKKVFNSSGTNILYFVNKDNICVTYELVGGQIQVTRGAVSGFLTPAKITISNLVFSIVDTAVAQPKVTILIDARMALGKSKNLQNIKLQTTVSSRYYE